MKDYGSLADIGKSGRKILQEKIKKQKLNNIGNSEIERINRQKKVANVNVSSQAKINNKPKIAKKTGEIKNNNLLQKNNQKANKKEKILDSKNNTKKTEVIMKVDTDNATKKELNNENIQILPTGMRSRKITSDVKTYNAGLPKKQTLERATKNSEKDLLSKAANLPPKTLITTNSHKNNNRLKIMFLGGVGEIGKNMTILEFNEDIIVIDAGLSFPGADMPGVDVVIPDFAYLEQNKDRIRGVVITHGHEDHIGAVPFLLQKMNVPIFGSRLTNAILENKIKEKTQLAQLHTVEPRDRIKLGCFEVEFIQVNHSIAGAFALAISTPVGLVVHTGDFKIDFEPIDGNMIDLVRMAELGKKGVQLLLAESTNVEREGYTESERNIGKKLERIFEDNAERRMFVATFSSNIYRIQQILDLAIKFKRKVAIVGRSMQNNIEAGNKIGCFDFPKDLFIDIEKINQLFPKEVLVLCTGAQGEPTSALSRLASGQFNKIEIGDEDTIILSSSPIPGNESMINKVINSLYKKGAIVIHENVHTSGHACREEIKTIHSLLRPKFFIPVHGEYRHLKKHAMLAEDLGMDKFDIVIPELGTVAELSSKALLVTGSVQAGELPVDGLGIGDLDSDVLRDRKALSEDGMVIVVVSVSESSGKIVNDPYMITRGFVYDTEAQRLVEEGKKIVMETLSNMDFTEDYDFSEIRAAIRKPLRNYFYKETGRNPMILPVVFKA